MKMKHIKTLFRKTLVNLWPLQVASSLGLACRVLGSSCNECNPDCNPGTQGSSTTSFPAKTVDVHCCTLTVYNTGSPLLSQVSVACTLCPTCSSTSVSQNEVICGALELWSHRTELINDNKFFLYFLSLFVWTFIFTTTRLTQLTWNWQSFTRKVRD